MPAHRWTVEGLSPYIEIAPGVAVEIHDDGSEPSMYDLRIGSHRQHGEGKVSFTMPGPGGAVDDTGAAVPGWVSDFLADAARADVVSKLARSGAARTEVLIAVTLDGAPWSVASYLTGDVTVVPTAAPQLPSPIAGVWICPTHGTKGVYWHGSGWRVVLARPEE
jgi:hypothetical protein